MEEMARSIAIVFSLPASAVTTRAGLGLAPLADESTRRARDAVASSSLTHARSGWNERKREHGWEGWCRRSVKLMALTGEVDFVWSTWPGSRFSHLSRYTKTSSIGQCIPLQARVGIAASYYALRQVSVGTW